MYYFESNFDKKRIMLEYYEQQKSSEENKNKINQDSELLTLYSELNSKNEQIMKKVKILAEGKKGKEEKENITKEIYEINNTLESIYKKINEFNPKTTLNKNYSFNIELIKVLISELNSKKEQQYDLDNIYTIVMQLVDIILFNQLGYNICEEIYNFIENYFFKTAKENLIQKLFEHLIQTYINKENKYRNVATIIGNKIWMLFDIKLFLEELKKCFNRNEKENENKWCNKNFAKIFYKISILINIIIRKLVIKEQRETITLKEMSENVTQFIQYIIDNKNNLKNEYSDLILNSVLSLYNDHILLINDSERIKDIEPDKQIDFLIDILLLNENKKVKDKIENLIQLLLYPYKDKTKSEGNKVSIYFSLKNDNSKEEENVVYYGDKIIIMLQKKLLEHIEIVNKNKIIDKEENKLKYALSLLNTGYTLKQSDNKENENTIKQLNNKIIEGFIKILAFIKTKENIKVGFSEINNFWRYLSSLLEKGSMNMLFDNDNFTTLVINCYLKLDKESQILLYTKLTNLFLNLYNSNKDKNINTQAIFQIFNVIDYIMKNCLNDETDKEKHLLDFLNNLLEIILYGAYNEKELKFEHQLFLDFNIENHLNIIKNLFFNCGKFLLLKLNYSSFGQSECGNELIYKRSCFMKYLLIIIEKYSKLLFVKLKEEEIKDKEIRQVIKNYLIFFIFNYIKMKNDLPPVLNNIAEIRNLVNKIIKSCTENKNLIKINLENIVEIVKKIDAITFEQIKEGKISNKKGLKIIYKLFNSYYLLLNIFLVNDEITKYFAFELDGFKFSIDKINIHNSKQKKVVKKKEKKEKNLIDGINEMESESEEEITDEKNNDTDEDNIELNSELVKMIENDTLEDIGIKDNKNVFNKQENEFMEKFIYFKNIQNPKEDKKTLKTTNIFSNLYMDTLENPFLSKIKPFNINNLIINTDKTYNRFLKLDGSDSQLYTGDLSKYKTEEFATQKRLYPIEGGVAQYSNTYNWSSKKKPTNSYIIAKEMKGKKYYEENIDYQLSYPIDIREVLITFSQTIKLTDEIPEIYLECGMDYKKMDICVKLERIKDEQYNERGVFAYGFNFFSHKPELLKDDDNYIENYINQLIKCHAQYIRFIVRRPVILSNKNTHISDINLNKLLLGINCISITGVKFTNTDSVIEYISDMGKDICIKLISMIFTSEFIETLRHIAQDKSIFENIKQIYDAFEPNLNKYITIISKILINSSKYNYELGDWLMQRLLNIEHDQTYVKLAVEIMKNNPEYVDKRINKYCSFLFREIKSCFKKNKFDNIGYFIEYFCLTLNGLLLSPFIDKIRINIDLEEIRNIIFNLYKYKQIKKELINLITLILLPHEKIILNENEIDANKFYHPNNSLKTLTDLYNNSYSYDYTELLSYLVSNNIRFEQVFVESDTAKYFCELLLEEINLGIRGRNMLLMTEMLKNMSYNSDFVKFIRKNDYDFKLFESIKSKDKSSESILINNNTNFLKNIVIFLRNCISGDEESYKKLAKILIKDLDICKQKIDKEYANSVLIPLLSFEKVTYCCLHPINEKIKTNFCSYINFEAIEEPEKKETKETKENKTNNKDNNINDNDKIKDYLYPKFSYGFTKLAKPKQITTTTTNIFLPNKKETENIPKSIIHDSELSDEYQIKFTKLFNSFEYQKGSQFTPMTFKKIISSKGLTSDKLKTQVVNNISNKGPILIIIYPSTSEKYNKTYTFFYYDGIFPYINLSQNIDESEESITVPYNPKNMIAQISDKNYLTASYKSENDISKDYGFCSINIEEGGVSLSIMEIINLNLLEPKNNSNINPYLNCIDICQKSGMEDFDYISSISDYEVFIGQKIEKEDKQNILFGEYSNNKIIPYKYIDETGSLNINYIKQNKYYNSSLPFCLTRDNPIFEIPSNIKLKQLKDMFYSNLIQFKNLNSGEPIDDDKQIDQIEKYHNSNIVDLYYDIQSLKDFRIKVINGQIKSDFDFKEQIPLSVTEYEPNLPVLLNKSNNKCNKSYNKYFQK